MPSDQEENAGENKKPKQDDVGFVIPDGILHQINEMSAGGFLLFTINEYGEIVQYQSFDSPVHAGAVHRHIMLWSEAVGALGVDAFIDDMKRSMRRKKK